jgi:2-iminoacetate synthase ThiH
MFCRSFIHFPQKHANYFMPLPYQTENNDIPVQTPPTGFDALRTIAVSRIHLDNFDHITALLGGERTTKWTQSAKDILCQTLISQAVSASASTGKMPA